MIDLLVFLSCISNISMLFTIKTPTLSFMCKLVFTIIIFYNVTVELDNVTVDVLCTMQDNHLGLSLISWKSQVSDTNHSHTCIILLM